MIIYRKQYVELNKNYSPCYLYLRHDRIHPIIVNVIFEYLLVHNNVLVW
jgi:hypothetical protein